MSLETVNATAENLSRSGLLGDSLAVVWHAGEPLTVGPQFYSQAFEIFQRYSSRVDIVQHIQTNGMLIDQVFCKVFADYNVRIGVSIDGPAFLHDQCRKTRSGRPTHAQVMRGLQLLQEHGIETSVIAVLTNESLAFPDEIFQFFVDNRVRNIGFNVEELEGPNTQSSISSATYEMRLRSFMRRFMELVYGDNTRTIIAVREFWRLGNYAFRGLYLTRNAQSSPLAMINVDVDGNFTTFSPEFLGVQDERYGNFILGNVHKNLISRSVNTSAFKRLDADIKKGVERCREECAYFPVCGGGDPSNKYFENKDLTSTETKFCKMSIKAVSDVFLDYCEEVLGIRPHDSHTSDAGRFIPPETSRPSPPEVGESLGA